MSAVEAVAQAAGALEERLTPWHGEFLLVARPEEGPAAVVAPRGSARFDAAAIATALGSASWDTLASVDGAWQALRPALSPSLRDPYAPLPLSDATLDDALAGWFASTQRSVTRPEQLALQQALDAAGCALLGGFEAMTPGEAVRFAVCSGGGLAVVVFYAGDGP